MPRWFNRLLCWLGQHEYDYVNIPGRVMPEYKCVVCGAKPPYMMF
ncbi:hypothetical protein [Curtobacterium phage Reje]|nr:hypothetical protein QEJ62_gp19 [Curtobacterium phage Reje]QXG07827.1 hypothetical protein [Curtobacterium phage Reje]